ncbi:MULTISPECIES: helix-turn-helix transcriptional regulator [unclassified Cryobacterium]|uniref:helix-turn-helix domain-containing protein n=1 Tax=unclassified Cryobacterium TaxID=2649013 RepID=UPI00106A3E35|nr:MULTISPECIES: helix-turn-helix transcriptional regulator [unclassified Cryobacterium]TFD03617.1 transcriptional regulator [Cryobacterium sp. TMT1-66-1]TFD12922.1 transcriptional regulator [Cryobacterium sp. TMT1-2-2]
MPIVINLDVELAKKKMSVADFAAAIDITPANVSVLKNGRAKAVRFSTLDAICRVLDCQPGDIFMWVPEDEASTPAQASVSGS